MTDPTHKSPIKLKHVILIVNLTKVAVTVQRQGVGSSYTYNYVVSQFQHYQILIVKCFELAAHVVVAPNILLSLHKWMLHFVRLSFFFRLVL